jgi:hypothetical protein
LLLPEEILWVHNVMDRAFANQPANDYTFGV